MLMIGEKSEGSITFAPTVNETEEISPKMDETESERKKKFASCIFENIPKLLKEPCDKLDLHEKDVFLIGALGVVSGILPNYKAKYFGDDVEANLYCYVLGKYGTGKGGLKKARKIAESIHSARVLRTKECIKNYKKELAQYKKALKLFERGELEEEPVEPESPPHLKIYIPANISKTGILQLLNENNGRGIIFESEGDTLAEIFKQDYGNFSSDLRSAFHHEPLSYFRRGNNEDVEIAYPCVSVLLSSTFDQLLNLIPTIQNGLYSRFAYYELTGMQDFNDPFDSNRDDHSDYFTSLSTKYMEIYDHLVDLKQPLLFELTKSQQEIFLELFKSLKLEIREYVSEDLDGTVNRLGLICFRICMVLALLRAFETGDVCAKITCENQDFENALNILETLKWHSISVFRSLPKPKETESGSIENKDLIKMEQKIKCRELHKQGVGYREISVDLFGSDNKKTTVWRWING